MYGTTCFLTCGPSVDIRYSRNRHPPSTLSYLIGGCTRLPRISICFKYRALSKWPGGGGRNNSSGTEYGSIAAMVYKEKDQLAQLQFQQLSSQGLTDIFHFFRHSKIHFKSSYPCGMAINHGLESTTKLLLFVEFAFWDVQLWFLPRSFSLLFIFSIFSL